MKNLRKYIKIFVITSIAFMQTSNTFATVFSLNSGNYIQICTADGFKFLLKNNLGPIDYSDTKKVELMNCCLDVHSNILLSNNSLNKPIYLPTFNIINYKDIPENKNFKTKNYIRGPPRLI